MNDEQVEVAAVKLIKDYSQSNPRAHLTAREKHSLKNILKDRIWDYGFTDPKDVTAERLKLAQRVAELRERNNH